MSRMLLMAVQPTGGVRPSVFVFNPKSEGLPLDASAPPRASLTAYAGVVRASGARFQAQREVHV
ncbi:MAG: hypothetical protein QOH21_407 [Acidobacteriota bacterium]|nr:hypothetical protein [Acidobacteriota bacterium]